MVNNKESRRMAATKTISMIPKHGGAGTRIPDDTMAARSTIIDIA